ncbi:MAG: GNAT family N-acetyltransferase, partial [Lachnospiraceae bacterium]|nr:GNAT family N-acetyltransferase [Lachnospiraceae bacterium]
MKIMKLEREEEEYFGWLDPYGFLERLSLPDHFAFVSAEENGEADTPTGLVAACVRDSIIIEWLCVDTAHRGRGTGSALIGHLKELAEKNGIGLSARLTYAPDMTETMDNGAEFLMASGFVPTGDFCREWMTDLHTVFSMDYFRQDLKGLKETGAADGIPPVLLKKA